MKLRIYPKKSVVLGYLKNQQKEAEGRIEENHKRRLSIEGGAPAASARELLDLDLYDSNEAQYIEVIQDKIDLINSHDPPDTMMELDI